MSRYLTEAGWKSELGKAKNLGLRAQGTGVSDKLRKYEAVNNGYVKNKSDAVANTVIAAAKDLKTLAEQQSNAHKMFTEATNYLKEVVKAAKTREEEVTKDKKHITVLAAVKKALADAYTHLGNIKTAADFKKKGPGNLNGDVIALMQAGKFEKVSGDTMAKLNNRCMVDSVLAQVTDSNLAAKKDEVKKFLDKLKSELAAVKI